MQIAADFRIAESFLGNWMRAADMVDGAPPATTAVETAGLREARMRIDCWSK